MSVEILITGGSRQTAAMVRLLLGFCLVVSALAESALVEGRKVHYSSYGKGHKALVLVHGWTCDETFWASNVPGLSKQYRVVTVDLPGHGQSDPAPEYSMDAFADAVSAVMTEAKVKRATLVGHSMGGPVLLAFARRHREQVTALVAVDAAFSDPKSAARSQAKGRSFLGPDALTAREAIVRHMFSTATLPATREHILRVMLAVPEQVADGAIQGMRDPEFWREDRIDLPFLEIAAGSSAYITLPALRGRFPLAQIKRIRGTGHFLMMEKPLVFNRTLLAWLAARH
jgi:pimeloyl-ACP methyl ester carboxylesterase